MKVHFRFRDSFVVRWQQRGIERLSHALRVLAVDRQPVAQVPNRAMPSHALRQPQRRPWRA